MLLQLRVELRLQMKKTCLSCKKKGIFIIMSKTDLLQHTRFPVEKNFKLFDSYGDGTISRVELS